VANDRKILNDLFPNGDWPQYITPKQMEGFRNQHKAIVDEQRRVEEEQQQAERQEFLEHQARKDKIEYTEALAQEICERISSGELLIRICEEHHMPTLRRCNQWLKQNPDFKSLYQQSIQDRLTIFEEEVISIADDAANDFKEVTVKNQTKKVIDPDVIARAKLRIEVRFKHLRAGRPEKWGDTSTLITKSVDDDDPTSLSNDDLERKIAEIEAKEKILKSV